MCLKWFWGKGLCLSSLDQDEKLEAYLRFSRSINSMIMVKDHHYLDQDIEF